MEHAKEDRLLIDRRSWIVGFCLFVLGAVVGGPVMLVLSFKYGIRYVGPVPGIAFMLVPIAASSWVFAFAARRTPKKRHVLVGALVVSLLLSATLVFSAYRDSL